MAGFSSGGMINNTMFATAANPVGSTSEKGLSAIVWIMQRRFCGATADLYTYAPNASVKTKDYKLLAD